MHIRALAFFICYKYLLDMIDQVLRTSLLKGSKYYLLVLVRAMRGALKTSSHGRMQGNNRMTGNSMSSVRE